MATLTITEALSEVTLVKKKLESKRQKIQGSLIRYDHVPDPFASEGGSAMMISQEMQAIHDLSQRLSKIRAAISSANLTYKITIAIDGYEMNQSIHDWLIWKREIASEHLKFLQQVANKVKEEVDRFAKTPQVFKDIEGNPQLVKMIPNIDYAHWSKLYERHNEIFQKLDGQLSLKNATILIEI